MRRYNLRGLTSASLWMEHETGHNVKTRHGIIARDPARSVTAALKLANELLKAGELREAAKWVSVAAGLGAVPDMV